MTVHTRCFAAPILKAVCACYSGRVSRQAVVAVAILLILGCSRSKSEGGNVQTRPAVSMTKAEMVQMIGQLPSWPSKEPRLTRQDWLRLLRAAEELQQADIWTFREACIEYARRSEELSEGKPSVLEDYSRVFLLLRVMFDLPSEPYDPATHPVAGPPIDWFGDLYENIPDEQILFLASLLSYPIIWTREGPEIIGWLATMNGPPYDPAKDLDLLQANYRFRNLRPIIDALARTKAKKASPISPRRVQNIIDALARPKAGCRAEKR
jgi:hypothetical protein